MKRISDNDKCWYEFEYVKKTKNKELKGNFIYLFLIERVREIKIKWKNKKNKIKNKK